MNTNDILRALFNNEISADSVRLALENHDNFIKHMQPILAAGISVTVLVATSDPSIVTVSEALNINANLVLKFKNEEKLEIGNKIKRIKDFRNLFSVGLAEAKWAIEMLHEGKSCTNPPVRR